MMARSRPVPQTEGDVVHYEMCPYCEARQLARHGFPSPECPTCDKTGYVPVTTNGTITTLEGEQIWPPAPRAVVAISEDRQWLVVRGPIFWEVKELTYVDSEDLIPDTGQDAHEVLREFMEGRG